MSSTLFRAIDFDFTQITKINVEGSQCVDMTPNCHRRRRYDKYLPDSSMKRETTTTTKEAELRI